jgi:hypothetical protein
MKFSRSLQLTLSVAALMALTACGGGGESGPTWAQGTKQTIQTEGLAASRYDTACGDYGGIGLYSSKDTIVLGFLEGKPYTATEQNYYQGTTCDDKDLLVTVRYPKAFVTDTGTYVDAESGVATAQQSVLRPAGNTEVINIAASTTVQKGSDAQGDFYYIELVNLLPEFLPQGPSFTPPASFPEQQFYDLLGRKGNTIYLGDQSTVDEAVSPYPTKLNLDVPLTLRGS